MNMHIINTFIKSTRIILLTAHALRFVLLWLAAFLYFFLLLTILRLFNAPYSILKDILIIWAFTTALALAALFLVRTLRYFRVKGVIEYIQQRIPELNDSLLSSCELDSKASPGTSEELVDELIAETSLKLSTKSPAGIIPFKSILLKPLIAFAVAFTLNHVLFAVNPAKISDFLSKIVSRSSSSIWQQWYSVKPGSLVVPWGNTVEITIEQKQPIPGAPVLRIKRGKDNWVKPELAASGDTFAYSVGRAAEPAEYYVSWNEIESERFTLTPEPPPQLGNYEIRYYYPAYTEMPPATVRGNPNISAPAGSTVEIKAVSNKELRKAALYTSWKAQYPVKIKGSGLQIAIKLKQSGTYKFLIEDMLGVTDQDPPEYAIFITPDKAPDVELLSPGQNLIASPKDEIPLIVQAADDYGLTRIDLVYKINQKERERVTIDLPAKKTYSKTFEYRWKLAELNIRAGDKLTYYIEALDNDTVNGPKSTTTDPLLIETTDYDTEHKKIEKDLEGFRKELLQVLADQTAAKSNLKNVSLQFTATGYGLLSENQRKVKSGLKPPNDSLEKIVAKMETDPFTDYSTFAEYKGMLAHVEYLNDKLAPSAVAAVDNKDWKEVEKDQNEMIAVLEKLTLLSEDIWQYQKMRDLFDSGSELEKNAASLADKLKNNKAQPEDLKKTLAEINETLEKIRKQLSDMPQELPEDFINSPSVKQIDINKSKSLAEKLAEALDKGDFDTARKLAEELQSQLQEMLKTMQKAGEDVGFSKNSSQKLEQEMMKQKAELDKLIKKQEELLQQTEKLDENRRQALFKKQEGLLGELAVKQRSLIKLKEDTKSRVTAKMPYFDAVTQQTNKFMKLVLAEFEQKRVFYSQKYLDTIIKDMETEKGMLSGNAQLFSPEVSAQLSANTAGIQTGEKEILDKLKQRIADEVSKSDENKMNSLSGEQSSLSEDTKNFRKSLEEFSQKSSAIPPDAFDSLDGASADMKDASGKLSSKDTPSALESGRQALEKLQSGMGQLQGASGQMEGQSGNSGKPVSSSIQMKRSGGGSMGVHTAPVKLPGIEEYKPPKEFRQDILDALREKYPKEYEKVIKDYYKRLTE